MVWVILRRKCFERWSPTEVGSGSRTWSDSRNFGSDDPSIRPPDGPPQISGPPTGQQSDTTTPVDAHAIANLVRAKLTA
jgi:hypothetical protein